MPTTAAMPARLAAVMPQRRQLMAGSVDASALILLAAVLAAVADHGRTCRAKLVSSTRHTSSSKSMPAARAAIGTRL